MKLKVHNAVSVVTVHAARSDFIATLKQRYIESEGFVGSPTAVELVYRGQRLEDVKQLKDYDIHDGDVLAHVASVPPQPSAVGGAASSSVPAVVNSPAATAAAAAAAVAAAASPATAVSVDYGRVSSLLREAHRASLNGRPDPSDFPSDDWPTAWDRGTEWLAYPPVLTGATRGLPPEDVLEGGDTGGLDATDDDVRRFEALLARMHHGSNGGGSGAAMTEDDGDSTVTMNGSAAATVSGGGGGGGGGAATTTTKKNAPVATLHANDTADAVNETDAQRARDRALMRAMLMRLRADSRARKALVPRRGYSYGASGHGGGGDIGGDALVQLDEIGRERAAFKGGLPGGPTRVFRNLYVAQVGRFAFRLLHRMEGRWSGEAQVHLPGNVMALPDVRAVAVSLVFDDGAGVWRERQTLTSHDGLASSQYMNLRPVANGECRIELTDEAGHERPFRTPSAGTAAELFAGPAMAGTGPVSTAAQSSPVSSAAAAAGQMPSGGGGGRSATGAAAAGGGPASHSPGPRRWPPHFSGGGGVFGSGGGAGSGGGGGAYYDMTLAESGESMLVVTAVSRATGRVLLAETITLISDMQRVRTVQRFDEASGGGLECFVLIRENRVLDSVTAAVDRYPKGYYAAAGNSR